jgi:hypothetical protein
MTWRGGGSSEVALADEVAHGKSLVLGLVMERKHSMASGPTSGGRGEVEHGCDEATPLEELGAESRHG